MSKERKLWTFGIVVAVSFLILPSIQTVYAILPTGTWRINGKFRGDLIITSVDGAGRLSGTAYGQNIIGFWDEASQKIMFPYVKHYLKSRS